jgi:hypothetical protein
MPLVIFDDGTDIPVIFWKYDEDEILEFPECGELMSACPLNDLNKCDNCGCPAHHFQPPSSDFSICRLICDNRGWSARRAF